MNLSIENAPADLVHRLERRAARNHRSLRDELMAIIEAAVDDVPFMTPHEVLAEVRKLDLRSPSESAAMIRADRDSR